MNFNDFEKIVFHMNEQDKIQRELSTEFCLDVSTILSPYDDVISIFLINEYTENGEDIFWWWLYESTEKIIDVDGEEYDVTNINDLWLFLEKFYREEYTDFNKEKQEIKDGLH